LRPLRRDAASDPHGSSLMGALSAGRQSQLIRRRVWMGRIEPRAPGPAGIDRKMQRCFAPGSTSVSFAELQRSPDVGHRAHPAGRLRKLAAGNRNE